MHSDAPSGPCAQGMAIDLKQYKPAEESDDFKAGREHSCNRPPTPPSPSGAFRLLKTQSVQSVLVIAKYHHATCKASYVASEAVWFSCVWRGPINGHVANCIRLLKWKINDHYNRARAGGNKINAVVKSLSADDWARGGHVLKMAS